jgi:bacteriocin-like protein
LGLHNNGFTGIDQPNTYSRGSKMTTQKQMTEKELDQVSGGPHIRDFSGRPGVIEKRNSSAGVLDGLCFPIWGGKFAVGQTGFDVGPIGRRVSATDNDHKDW